MKRYFTLLLSATLALVILSCQKEVRRDVIDKRSDADLISLIKVNFSYSLFYHALQLSGQDSLFGHGTPYTILMPDNSAFVQIGIGSDTALDKMDKDSLRHWVRYHILPGALPSGDVPRTINAQYVNLDGQILYFTNNGTQIRVNGKPLLSVDLKGSDGYIDVLPTPLPLPYPSVKQFLLADSNFSFFTAGLKKFGLLDQLDSGGPYTVIAPMNAAYQGYGITLDSIEKMDPQHFKSYLYSVSVIRGLRIFSYDFTDPVFTLNGAGGSAIQGDNANFTWFTDGGILMNVYWQDPNYLMWEVEDRHRTRLDPTYGTPSNPCPDNYCSTAYLGPNYWNNEMGFSGSPAYIVYPDRVARNGIVDGLNDVLVFSDSLRIQ